MTSAVDRATFVSIGYQGRSVDELVALLVGAGVDVLVDVRLNAISRKKGFSKTALAAALGAAGIEYRHERTLGNPKGNRDPFREGVPAARERYLHHLSNGASATHEELVALARSVRVALLCYERDHGECHRSCIIDAAQQTYPGVDLVKV